jgi:hypothetical protein
MIFGNGQQQNGALNLSAQGNSSPMAAQMNPFASQGMMQQASQNTFVGGMMGGMGMQANMMQQPIQPPSEMEIQMAMMRSLAPIDRFVVGAQMAVFLQMMNDLVSFSVLEMKMDVTSLPDSLQTMSAENVKGQFSNLQMASQQSIQNAEMQQQQIAAFAQQSMMGGALSAALANDNLMDKAGSAAGKFMGNFMGTR